MRRIKDQTIRFFKKFTSNFKRSWRKLKYLDKTQLNYFIVTSFIGIFCLFTGFTYSLFTVSKYLSAATITIAKLNYTLSSSTSGYSNGSISVEAGQTAYVDLTLSSLNPFETKYALNYNTTSSDISVYYSHNLKYNITGTIGTSGSSITMRVVIINSGSSAATVNFTVAGGYVQNSLSSNIVSGFYEQDVVVRTTLLDENFGNPTAATDFPDETSSYAYYKTECNETANPVWDIENWTLNLNNLSKQVSCDVYFKKMTDDIEIYFMLQDKNGENGTIANSVPNDGTYTFKGADCSSGTATWDTENWQLSISDINGKTVCMAYFNSNN